MNLEYVLGTAQLGMNYGIANEAGQPNQEKANAIVFSAINSGVTLFDTAQGYLASEKVLGLALESCGANKTAKVITKLNPNGSTINFNWVYQDVCSSIKKLRVEKLFGIMLHRCEWLKYWGDGLGRAICELKVSGLCDCIGVSVYSISELLEAVKYSELEIFQIPSNLWDANLFLGDYISALKQHGKTIFVRSLFLQGLLLLSPQEVKIKLPQAYEASFCWHNICEYFKTTPYDLSLRFAAALDCPVVIGADSEEQVSRNSDFLSVSPLSKEEVRYIYETMKQFLTEEIINPSLWSKK